MNEDLLETMNERVNFSKESVSMIPSGINLAFFKFSYDFNYMVAESVHRQKEMTITVNLIHHDQFVHNSIVLPRFSFE